MSMKNNLLLFLFLAITVIGCKKDDKEKVYVPPSNFQPVTSGCSWTYSEYPNVSVFTVSMTGIIDTISGKKYYQKYNTDEGFSWFRKDKGNYYEMRGFGNDTLELLYLKEDVPAGTTWQISHTLSGFDTRFKYTLLEYDVPKLINGYWFQRCIQTRLETFVDYGGPSDSLVSTYNYIYANDIGLAFIEKSPQELIYITEYKIY